MAELDAGDRSVLHVLAFLFFRMGADERAGRLYAALAALPPPYPDGGNCDARALLGLAAVALARGDAEEALAHLRPVLRQADAEGSSRTRRAALAATAHLLRARALRTVGRMEESAAEADLYRRLAGEETRRPAPGGEHHS